MLVPISDDNRQLYRRPVVTTTLLMLNVVVFFFLQGLGGDAFTYGYSAIPYELTTGQDLVQDIPVDAGGQVVHIPQAPGPPVLWLTALTAMFMHGGLMHLLGNLLYLWIFGDNVENRFGHRVFLAFYLVSGLAATAAQVALDPASMVPTLGASGAISGVLGAYLVLFPRNQVQALLFLWVVSVPAVVAIGMWIVYQLVSGWGALSGPGDVVGGVAYAAHIGGFLAGVLMALVLKVVVREERPNLYQVTVHRR